MGLVVGQFGAFRLAQLDLALIDRLAGRLLAVLGPVRLIVIIWLRRRRVGRAAGDQFVLDRLVADVGRAEGQVCLLYTSRCV